MRHVQINMRYMHFPTIAHVATVKNKNPRKDVAEVCEDSLRSACIQSQLPYPTERQGPSFRLQIATSCCHVSLPSTDSGDGPPPCIRILYLFRHLIDERISVFPRFKRLELT